MPRLMKLVSLQSRGNRIARIIKTRTSSGHRYDVIGKTMRYSDACGISITVLVVDWFFRKERALKVANAWLEAAEQ